MKDLSTVMQSYLFPAVSGIKQAGKSWLPPLQMLPVKAVMEV